MATSNFRFSFGTPPKAVMEFTAGSPNAADGNSENAISKSDLVNIRLYSYDWTINNYSMIKCACDEASAAKGPSFPIGPLKNMELQPVLWRNGDNLKIEFRLVKDMKQTEEMKINEAGCPFTSALCKSTVDLEFLDSCGKTIDFYLSLPSEVKFINTKRIISWTKEENVSRFISEDSLTLRAKLSFRYYSNEPDTVTELQPDVESIKVFRNDMRNLFCDRKRFPDIVIKVGGQFVVAHKAILFTQYPHFVKFAKSDAELNVSDQAVLPSKLPTDISSILKEDYDTLCIPNEKVDVFLSVLHFIYCRKLHATASVNDFAVYKFAEKYGIRELSMILLPSEIKVNSEIEVEKVTYTWYVKNFSSMDKGFASAQSPSFKCGKDRSTTWCVGIFRLDSENIVLNLQRLSDLDVDIQTTFKLAVCKTDGSIHDQKEYRHLFTASTISNCHPVLMNAVSRVSITPELLHNDTLTVRCDLSVSTDGIISRQKYIYPADYPDIDISYWQSNFKNLLQKQSFSDATLLVDDKEIKIHKAILSARSPVYSRMFESDMEEKRSGCVTIEDISGPVLEKALHYIYSGEFPDLTMEHAPELYRTADKYEIMDLKMRCSEFILKNMNVDSACEVFILADLYDDMKLKNAAKRLICKNSAEALLSPRGIELITNYSPLARDILKHLSDVFCSSLGHCVGETSELRSILRRPIVKKPRPITSEHSVSKPTFRLVPPTAESRDMEIILSGLPFSTARAVSGTNNASNATGSANGANHNLNQH